MQGAGGGEGQGLPSYGLGQHEELGTIWLKKTGNITRARGVFWLLPEGSWALRMMWARREHEGRKIGVSVVNSIAQQQPWLLTALCLAQFAMPYRY